MRYEKVIEVIKLLIIFIKRNVFNIGVLRDKLFKFIITIGGIILIAVISFLMFSFFDNSQSTIEQTQIVLDINGIATMMWTFIIFLFMKILFMKKDSFMLFTKQLPISKREKKVAILFFELIIAITIQLIIGLSLFIALIFKYNFQFITRMICNVLFVSVTWYLILELINSIIILVFDFFKLNKIKNIAIYCIFTIVFLLTYKLIYPLIVDKVLFGYIDGEKTSIFLIYSYIMDNYGFIFSLITFIVIAFITSILILSLPKELESSTCRYIKLGNGSKNINFLKAYILNFARGVDAKNYLIISIALYALLIITKVPNAIYIMILLSVNGIYSYIQTESLRMISIQKKYSAIKDYYYLIISQYIYISLVSIPFVIISCILEKNIKSNMMIFPTIALSVIIFTLIGIIIPPKRENPFTAIIGFAIILLIISIIIITCFLMHLKNYQTVLIMMSVIAFSIYYSIDGLIKLKEEIRFER